MVALLLPRVLGILLAHHLLVATACQEPDYVWMIQHYCLKQFQLTMENIGQRLWCDWDETLGAELLLGGHLPWGIRVGKAPQLGEGPYLQPWQPQLDSTYAQLTNCTVLLAERLGCFWPNTQVDQLFLTIHRDFFWSCSTSGRALRDPPPHVLCPFVLLPVLVTLLMTALVGWRSKRSQALG